VNLTTKPQKKQGETPAPPPSRMIRKDALRFTAGVLPSLGCAPPFGGYGPPVLDELGLRSPLPLSLLQTFVFTAGPLNAPSPPPVDRRLLPGPLKFYPPSLRMCWSACGRHPRSNRPSSFPAMGLSVYEFFLRNDSYCDTRCFFLWPFLPNCGSPVPLTLPVLSLSWGSGFLFAFLNAFLCGAA